MIIEYTYDEHTLLNTRCYKCEYLRLDEHSQICGDCTCKENKVKNRFRSVTDRCCSWKKLRT